MSIFLASLSTADSPRWHFLDADLSWKEFDIVNSSLIENTLSRAQTSVTIQHMQRSFKVDTKRCRMVASETLHGNVLVKRLINYHSTMNHCWEWDDKGIWVEYDHHDIAFFEKAISVGFDSVRIHVIVGTGVYEFLVDFNANLQTSMTPGRGKGFQRSIRRRALTPSPSSTTTITTITTTTRASIPVTNVSSTQPIIDPKERLIRHVITKSIIGTASRGEECIICLETFKPCSGSSGSLSEDSKASLRLHECGEHFYHYKCVYEQLRLFGKCAYCNRFYLQQEGNQPIGATMSYDIRPPSVLHLEGQPANVGTIVIKYDVPSGIQGPEHPNPGVAYTGTRRTAYLPDTEDGKECLRLLERAFHHRLIFTIGQSVSTGVNNTVVWNGIHHKTSPSGGVSRYGWPDETYFNRLKEELLAKGITSS